jgi:SPP1 gp7 family putative phage head morphogenesis protein
VARAVRPSKRAELEYRAVLMRIVGWCEAVGAQRVEDLRQHWPVADAVAADAKKPKHGPDLVEQTRIVARKVTDVRNKRGVVRRVLREVDKRLASSVQAAIGIDISGMLDLQSGGRIAVAMEQAAAQNAGLIESIPIQYLARVQRAVSEAFGTGQRIESLAKTIREIGDITERRAALIARDQVSKMNASFNQVRQVGAGIEEYVWSGALDKRERPSHRAMEGTTHRWDSPPDVDGEHVHPGEAIACRCIAAPRFSLADIAGEEPNEERQAA